MIETCKAFKVGEQTFATIEAAQEAAIEELGFTGDVAANIVTQGAKIAAILAIAPAKKTRRPYTRKPKEAAAVAPAATTSAA